MTIGIRIRSNAWDLLFDLRLDRCAGLPPGEFCTLITRECGMESEAIPGRKAGLAAFIGAATARCGIETDAHCGFRDDRLPPDERRTALFGLGRFITEDESGFGANAPWRSGDPLRKLEVKLRRNEADIALAERSFRGVVLTRDAKAGALADANQQGGTFFC